MGGVAGVRVGVGGKVVDLEKSIVAMRIDCIPSSRLLRPRSSSHVQSERVDLLSLTRSRRAVLGASIRVNKNDVALFLLILIAIIRHCPTQPCTGYPCCVGVALLSFHHSISPILNTNTPSTTTNTYSTMSTQAVLYKTEHDGEYLVFVDDVKEVNPSIRLLRGL